MDKIEWDNIITSLIAVCALNLQKIPWNMTITNSNNMQPFVQDAFGRFINISGFYCAVELSSNKNHQNKICFIFCVNSPHQAFYQSPLMKREQNIGLFSFSLSKDLLALTRSFILLLRKLLWKVYYKCQQAPLGDMFSSLGFFFSWL